MVSSALKDALSYTSHEIDGEKLFKAGFQQEETFIKCTYSGVNCKLDEMKQFLDAQFGNCFVFNWNGTRFAERAGAISGALFSWVLSSVMFTLTTSTGLLASGLNNT